jgi:hypothetical protein
MSFKDKDVKMAQDIFKQQEEKPDHVDYEFRVWKGRFLFLLIWASECLIRSVDA